MSGPYREMPETSKVEVPRWQHVETETKTLQSGRKTYEIVRKTYHERVERRNNPSTNVTHEYEITLKVQPWDYSPSSRGQEKTITLGEEEVKVLLEGLNDFKAMRKFMKEMG